MLRICSAGQNAEIHLGNHVQSHNGPVACITGTSVPTLNPDQPRKMPVD